MIIIELFRAIFGVQPTANVGCPPCRGKNN